MMRPHIVNVAENIDGWDWIKHRLPDDEQARFKWTFVSVGNHGPIGRMMPHPYWGRIRAGVEVRALARRAPIDQLITHGPRISFYTAAIAGRNKRVARHLAMAFNFTDLPFGRSRAPMARAFQLIDRFVVFSRMERELYANHFDLPIERFDFLRWGVNPPIVSPSPRRIAEPYFVALGSEARDYPTMMEAARRMPSTKFALIVRERNLVGLSIPDNVEVFVSLPWADAWSMVWHAEAAIVPLRNERTPNGHVTIVGGMHIGKCHVVTDSAGVRDYVADEETALLVPPADPAAMVRAIERLRDQPELAARLGHAAHAFAARECVEDVTVRYFRDFAAQSFPS